MRSDVRNIEMSRNVVKFNFSNKQLTNGFFVHISPLFLKKESVWSPDNITWIVMGNKDDQFLPAFLF